MGFPHESHPLSVHTDGTTEAQKSDLGKGQVRARISCSLNPPTQALPHKPPGELSALHMQRRLGKAEAETTMPHRGTEPQQEWSA